MVFAGPGRGASGTLTLLRPLQVAEGVEGPAVVRVEPEAGTVSLDCRPGLATQALGLAEVVPALGQLRVVLDGRREQWDRLVRAAGLQQLPPGVVFAAGQVAVGGRPVAGLGE